MYFKWPILKIHLFPFGGLTIFETKLNTPIKQEFLVSIFGSIFQIIGFFILERYNPDKTFLSLHYTLLVFNLFPMIPLDGSKIIKSLLEYFISYQKSFWCLIIISFISYFFFIIGHSFSLISILIIILLFQKIVEEIKNKKLYFEKFLLERYLYSFPYRKILQIKEVKKMRKECFHYICGKSEKTVLKKYFSDYHFF